MARSKWFDETAMLLFLNKKDLFEDKFVTRKVPIPESLFPGAPGIETPAEEVMQWFVDKFKATVKKDANGDKKDVYHHCTCATDTQNVATVFNACFDIILKDNLGGSSFLES